MPSIAKRSLRSLLLLLMSACGTYTHVRPADNLVAGRFEANVGLSTNGVGDVVPVVAGAVGLTDWLELEGQYEVYSGFAELRAGLLSSARNGIALAIGAGGGAASLVYVDAPTTGALVGDVALGRRVGIVDLYAGDRIFVLPSLGTTLNSVRGGVRVSWKEFFVGAEGGATLHDGLVWVGEGSLLVGFGL